MVAPSPPLKLLHLEDSVLDHELAMALLQRGGVAVQVQRIETEAELRQALGGETWDLVVSDYNLPGFDGLQALDIVRAHDSGLPFILVSGEIGEDTAVSAMRAGASDYLLKSNLARLAPAVLQAVAAGRERRARQAADRELALSRQRLAELARHLQTRIEAERADIAREIHDDVGGTLTALKFELDGIRRHLGDPALAARAAAAQELLGHALEASQRIMHNLRPAILEQGLVPALQWLTSRFERRTGVACTLRAPAEVALPPLLPLVAYRFVQEALTNVSKHAQASRVSVDLSLAGGVLSVEVVDNGRGLSEADLTRSGRFGLRGLRERAATVGGWVEIVGSADHAGAGGGTTLLLSLPTDPAAGSLAAGLDDAPAPAGAEAQTRHDASAWGHLK